MDYPLDDRASMLLGGFDENGQPVPIHRDHLVEVVEKWPRSEHTPTQIAEQLRVSRELFTHSLPVWEFSAVGVTWSLMALESALRWALGAPDKERFNNLIDRGRREGLYDDATSEFPHVGRKIRNRFSHPKQQPAMTLGMAAPMIENVHHLVAEISDTVAEGAPDRPVGGS